MQFEIDKCDDPVMGGAGDRRGFLKLLGGAAVLAGKSFLPLPSRERVGVRGQTHEGGR